MRHNRRFASRRCDALLSTIAIALIGTGKIARDQRVPAIGQNNVFELVAAASPVDPLSGVPNFPSVEALFENVSRLDAVAVCTPPQVRYRIARYALEHGCHVLLEKPPGSTLREVRSLISMAQHRQLTLFAAWHAREASGVQPARDWLAQRRVRNVQVHWKEDVRIWHPGQAWIWKARGLGRI